MLWSYRRRWSCECPQWVERGHLTSCLRWVRWLLPFHEYGGERQRVDDAMQQDQRP